MRIACRSIIQGKNWKNLEGKLTCYVKSAGYCHQDMRATLERNRSKPNTRISSDTSVRPWGLYQIESLRGQGTKIRDHESYIEGWCREFCAPLVKLRLIRGVGLRSKRQVLVWWKRRNIFQTADHHWWRLFWTSLIESSLTRTTLASFELLQNIVRGRTSRTPRDRRQATQVWGSLRMSWSSRRSMKTKNRRES